MGRQKSERRRIYKETVDKVLKDYDLNSIRFSDLMEYSSSWYSKTFSKGYYDITVQKLRMWAILIGCTEEELLEIPVAKGKVIPAEDFVTVKKLELDMTELYALLTDGFRMLHQDLLILTETMDKYWKPTEPKYEVKEREQP